jgi:hypothetical protein
MSFVPLKCHSSVFFCRMVRLLYRKFYLHQAVSAVVIVSCKDARRTDRGPPKTPGLIDSYLNCDHRSVARYFHTSTRCPTPMQIRNFSTASSGCSCATSEEVDTAILGTEDMFRRYRPQSSSQGDLYCLRVPSTSFRRYLVTLPRGTTHNSYVQRPRWVTFSSALTLDASPKL